MSAAAPWSVKGIDPKAREIAKDLARRSGMTLGEWLNSMIMEDGDEDEGYTPLPRRPHAVESYERRGRHRRLEDAYGADDEAWQRLSASVDAIAARLEAAERRSTVAIQGVDQAVAGLLRRLEAQDQNGRQVGRRVDDIAEELREGHRRLRKFEQEAGPKTLETFGKVEASLGALAGRLYDIEERQRSGVNELRQRMDAVEKTAGPGVGAELLAQVGARLDLAQARTTDALKGLERSFAGLDQRLREAEGRIEPEGVREAARFEKLAETLSRQVEASRAEMMRRLDTAETDNRIDKIERTVLAIGEQLKASESRSAKAVESMGREVLRIAENLNARVGRMENAEQAGLDQLGAALGRKVEADIGRAAAGLEQRLEQRLVAADDRHALALERLGGEITRISDRLSERIAQSERRSQQALEDIGRRLADSSHRIEQRYDRASGELAERMRLSEERTAALIAEARENIERRAPTTRSEPLAPPVEPDWRAAAFPDAAFPDAVFPSAGYVEADMDAGAAWAGETHQELPEPLVEMAESDPVAAHGPSQGPSSEAPFGSRAAAEAEPVSGGRPAAAAASTPFGQPGFGGADVSDALAATAPEPFDSEEDEFSAETDFVDPRALRAAAAQGRASATRQTIDAARAAMATSEAEPPARSGFGLKRGGKSRLQERLDKQSSKEGGAVRKALGASAVAVLLTSAGALAYTQLAAPANAVSAGSPESAGPQAEPIAMLATTPADAARGEALYEQAMAKLDADDLSGLDPLHQAAELGYAPAQLHLAGLYQEGGRGVATDPSKARDLTRRAADGGDVRGMHAYGMYLFDGAGGPRNRPEALSWLLRAAERGLVDSQYNVARLYETGEEAIPADPVQALKWYLIAARAGDGDARSAAERLEAGLPAATRQRARAEAERFAVEPYA